MNFNLENRDNFSILSVNEKAIESSIAAELKAQILVAAQPEIEALLIDLSNVDMIDSSGLGALLLAYMQLKNFDIPVVLIGLQNFIVNLLHITHIDSIFIYYDSVEDALIALKSHKKN
jgi:anti-anti-sigma factor